MALKVLILRSRLEKAKKDLEGLREKDAGFVAREAELEAAITLQLNESCASGFAANARMLTIPPPMLSAVMECSLLLSMIWKCPPLSSSSPMCRMLYFKKLNVSNVWFRAAATT